MRLREEEIAVLKNSLMNELIKKLCTKCKSYFENSEDSCISTISLKNRQLLLLTSFTFTLTTKKPIYRYYKNKKDI